MLSPLPTMAPVERKAWRAGRLITAGPPLPSLLPRSDVTTLNNITFREEGVDPVVEHFVG